MSGGIAILLLVIIAVVAFFAFGGFAAFRTWLWAKETDPDAEASAERPKHTAPRS